MADKKTATETQNVFTQMVDLLNESYKTYLKTLVWSQERALELTRAMVSQAETTQAQGRGLVEEYTKQFTQGTEVVRDAFQQITRNSTEAMKEAQDLAEKNVAEVTERLNNTAKAAAKNN